MHGDLLLRGGNVLGADGRTERADVVIHDGRVLRLASVPEREQPHGAGDPGHAAGEGRRRAETIDASGLVVAPGFVDLQCNGAGGIDLTAEPHRLWEVAALLPRWGVTAWLPTVVTSPEPVRKVAREVLAAGPPSTSWTGALPLGLHFEGPFLAPERQGAHAEGHLQVPSLGAIEGWSAAEGLAVVTLAPELPGALDVVRALVERGVVVSAGHSSATAEEAEVAVDAGVTWVTHLFNAMGPLHHRDPGLAAVALTDERLTVGMIVDGLHVHPKMVDLAVRALGGRLTLVTDAVAALGAAAGRVRLGDREAVAGEEGGEGVRLADGTLAGSAVSMDRAVANLMAFTGCDLGTAVIAASAAPARLVDRPDGEQRGVVAPGAVADLVLLDPRGLEGSEGSEVPAVVATIVGGQVVYQRDGWNAGVDDPAGGLGPESVDGATGPKGREDTRWR